MFWEANKVVSLWKNHAQHWLSMVVFISRVFFNKQYYSFGNNTWLYSKNLEIIWNISGKHERDFISAACNRIYIYIYIYIYSVTISLSCLPLMVHIISRFLRVERNFVFKRIILIIKKIYPHIYISIYLYLCLSIYIYIYIYILCSLYICIMLYMYMMQSHCNDNRKGT